jgi:hypothetical protein
MLVKADEDRYVLRFGLPHAIFGFHGTADNRKLIREALDLLRSHVISRACAIDALDPDADVSCEPPDDATIEER